MMKTMLTGAVASALITAAGLAMAQSDQGAQSGTAQPGTMMDQNQDMPMMQRDGRHGMMERGHGMMGKGMERGMMSPHMMLIMMAMVDADGSQTLSLEEVQAVHARIFKYADADSDGELTLDEMRAFMHGDQVRSAQ